MQFQNVLYFLLWAGFIFLMMRFGCGAHVMGHGHHHHNESNPDDRRNSSGRGPLQTSTRDVDPVCGKTVDTATAKSAAYQGHIYYFCSQDCREKFEAARGSYAKAVDTAPQARKHHHGC
jgi:YHS domain-containing protein